MTSYHMTDEERLVPDSLTSSILGDPSQSPQQLIAPSWEDACKRLTEWNRELLDEVDRLKAQVDADEYWRGMDRAAAICDRVHMGFAAASIRYEIRARIKT